MTPEQDRAMMAVLKAIAKARRTGLTEQQISDRIERTKPDKALEGASSAPAGDDAGWNPLTEEFPDADASPESSLWFRLRPAPKSLDCGQSNVWTYGYINSMRYEGNSSRVFGPAQSAPFLGCGAILGRRKVLHRSRAAINSGSCCMPPS